MEGRETHFPALNHVAGSWDDVREFLTSSRDELVALAYLLTGSRDQAQDVVHDVFVRLLRADTSKVSDLRAYARRAVCNESASWGRSLARQLRRGQSLRAEWIRDLNTRPDPFGRVEIMSALAGLPTRQRAAVVMRYYLGLNDTEIADVLGCAPVTVRSLLSRALRRLRTELNADGKNGDEHHG